MKTFLCLLLISCTLTFNSLASKGVEIKHETQFCAAEVYFKYPDLNPPQEEIDKSNRERTTVTLREYITLTATLDGKKLPEGTRCSWTAVVGEEYFKLEKNEFRSDQITVNINTLAKEQQKIKVKAEVDGVEQEIEFTLIPPKGLTYAGAESPFQKALDEAAKIKCTTGLSALRILRIFPLNVSFTNLYSLEQHAGYDPEPLPDHPLVSEHKVSANPARVSVTNEIYDSTNCLYRPEDIDAFTGSISWTWKCRWQIFGCTGEVKEDKYTKERILWDFNTDQIFTIRRDPVTGTVHYQIQKFKGLNKKDPGIVTATSN